MTTNLPVDGSGRVEVRIYQLPPAIMGVKPHAEDWPSYRVKAWGGQVELEKLSHMVDVDVEDGLRDSEIFLSNLWLVVEQGGRTSDYVGIPRLASNPAAIRSFVVGDVVVLGAPGPDQQTWLCDTVGWTRLE